MDSTESIPLREMPSEADLSRADKRKYWGLWFRGMTVIVICLFLIVAALAAFTSLGQMQIGSIAFEQIAHYLAIATVALSFATYCIFLPLKAAGEKVEEERLCSYAQHEETKKYRSGEIIGSEAELAFFIYSCDFRRRMTLKVKNCIILSHILAAFAGLAAYILATIFIGYPWDAIAALAVMPIAELIISTIAIPPAMKEFHEENPVVFKSLLESVLNS